MTFQVISLKRDLSHLKILKMIEKSLTDHSGYQWHIGDRPRDVVVVEKQNVYQVAAECTIIYM